MSPTASNSQNNKAKPLNVVEDVELSESCTSLLVGLYIGTTTSENSLAVSGGEKT